MSITRRDLLRTSAGLALTAAGGGLLNGTSALAQAGEELSFKPEEGAELRVLRWSKFVQGDEDQWNANTQKFTETTGVPVRLEAESWEDIRPKAAVAANVGSGPDIIFGWFDDPHQYPDKLVPLTDLADYLGNKYGGWYDAPKRYGMRDGEWIGLPLGAAGARMVYRKSWLNEVGFEEFPTDTQQILEVARKLKEAGHPMGMALGHAVGDGNGWTHTVLWGFGGKMVDDDNKVVINSPETIAALEWVKELYQHFIPGTLSWLDSNNNKAFLAGELGATNNGISVYYAAKKSEDPAVQKMSEDIFHQQMPVGPVGHPTELHLCTQAMVFHYTQFPNAAKEYLRFMYEKPQYEAWQNASLGYVAHPLDAYKDNAVWHDDPKALPYRDAVKNMLWNGFSGRLGYSSAAAMADYIVVDMFASVCTGDATPADAAAAAEKRANRFYRV
jgi:multiple sugar transport system substrate-binding protein